MYKTIRQPQPPVSKNQFSLPSARGAVKIVESDREPLLVSPRRDPDMFTAEHTVRFPTIPKLNLLATVARNTSTMSPTLNGSLTPVNMNRISSRETPTVATYHRSLVTENHTDLVPVSEKAGKAYDPDQVQDISTIPRGKRTMAQKIRYGVTRLLTLLGVEIPKWYAPEQVEEAETKEDDIMDDPRHDVDNCARDLVNDLSAMLIQLSHDRADIDGLRQQADDWRSSFELLKAQTDSINFDDWKDEESLLNLIQKTEKSIFDVDPNFPLSNPPVLAEDRQHQFLQLVGINFTVLTLEELVFVMKKRVLSAESKFAEKTAAMEQYESIEVMKREFASMKREYEILKQREIHFAQNTLLRRYNFSDLPLNSIAIFVSALQNELTVLRSVVRHVLNAHFHPFRDDLERAISNTYLEKPSEGVSSSNVVEKTTRSVRRPGSFRVASGSTTLLSKQGTGSFAVNKSVEIPKKESPLTHKSAESNLDNTQNSSVVPTSRRASGMFGASPLVAKVGSNVTIPKIGTNVTIAKRGTFSTGVSGGENNGNYVGSRRSSQDLTANHSNTAGSRRSSFTVKHDLAAQQAQPIPYLDGGFKFEQVYNALYASSWPLVYDDKQEDVTLNEFKMKLLQEEISRLKHENDMLRNEKRDDELINTSRRAAKFILSAAKSDNLEYLAEVIALPDETITHQERNKVLKMALIESRKNIDKHAKDLAFTATVLRDREKAWEEEKINNAKLLSLLQEITTHNPDIISSIANSAPPRSHELQAPHNPSALGILDVSDLIDPARSWIQKPMSSIAESPMGSRPNTQSYTFPSGAPASLA